MDRLEWIAQNESPIKSEKSLVREEPEIVSDRKRELPHTIQYMPQVDFAEDENVQEASCECCESPFWVVRYAD